MQDNRKIIRHEGLKGTLLAEEKGYNNYIKVDDSKCAIAAQFWKERRAFWNAVRQSWEEILATKKVIHLEQKSKGLQLYQQLNQVEKEKLVGTPLKAKLKDVLSGYLMQPDSKSVVAAQPVQ